MSVISHLLTMTLFQNVSNMASAGKEFFNIKFKTSVSIFPATAQFHFPHARNLRTINMDMILEKVPQK
jgi:hypothetical protein